MENNKGCLIYLAISLILALVIYKVQETTLFDAFLASLGLLFGVIILIAIIAVPIEKIITSKIGRAHV